MQRFLNLPVVLAVVFGIGFGASVFLNIQQHQRAQQEKKLLNGEIADLRYQVKQDQAALGGSGTPSPEPTESPEPTPSASPEPSSSPEVAGASTAPKTATVKAAANVRADASANSAKLISMLPAGTAVTLGSDVRNGYQQITVNGKTGYILTSYLVF